MLSEKLALNSPESPDYSTILADIKTRPWVFHASYRLWYSVQPAFDVTSYARLNDDQRMQNAKLQKLICEEFITPPQGDYASREAGVLRNFMTEKWQVSGQAISDTDVSRRPWYVVGAFCDFFSLQRLEIEAKPTEGTPDGLKEKLLLEIFPHQPLLSHAELAEDGKYLDELNKRIRNHLAEKFTFHAVPKTDETDELNYLRTELDLHLRAMRPQIRYLRDEYQKVVRDGGVEEKQRTKAAKIVDFLGHFLEKGE